MATFFAQYKTDAFVSNYLMREKGLLEEPATLLNVGLGCNSETFILADDVISLYASAMSITIKDVFAGNHPDGGCWMYICDDDGCLKVQRIEVPPYYCFDVKTWRVRISEQAFKDIVEWAEAAGTYETGGYLLGQCNLKTKTIHVIDTIEAPEDTIHRGDYLVLGKKGIRKKLSQVERRSGATFGYVGEWHSHPNGPNEFSATDYEEFANKVEEMIVDDTIKPILEILVAPAGMSCAVLTLS
jgi:proteasome lid subunit RPN8/RPN11